MGAATIKSADKVAAKKAEGVAAKKAEGVAAKDAEFQQGGGAGKEVPPAVLMEQLKDVFNKSMYTQVLIYYIFCALLYCTLYSFHTVLTHLQ